VNAGAAAAILLTLGVGKDIALAANHTPTLVGCHHSKPPTGEALDTREILALPPPHVSRRGPLDADPACRGRRSSARWDSGLKARRVSRSPRYVDQCGGRNVSVS
jgi:hypothetical protein